MKNNSEAIKIGAAYVGVIVGAGFSTGQEVLKFFTNYGIYSFFAIIIAGLMLTFFGRQITKMGHALEAESHEPTIHYLFGEKLGKLVDGLLVFLLYIIAVIMIAGSGSAFHESYGIPIWLGSLIMVIAIIITLMLDFNKIMTALGIVTPFLIVVVTIISVYFMFNGSVSLSEVHQYIDVKEQPFKLSFLPESSLWWFSGLNYGALAFATGYSILAAIGNDASRIKVAGRGGLLGGLTLLVLLLLTNIGLLRELDKIGDSAIPTLVLGRMIHPVIGVALSIIMLMVMYNTIVGLIYSFIARFSEPISKKYVTLLVISMVIGYFLSFIGFVKLVGIVYPAMGYIGMILCIGIMVKYFLRKKRGKQHIA